MSTSSPIRFLKSARCNICWMLTLFISSISLGRDSLSHSLLCRISTVFISRMTPAWARYVSRLAFTCSFVSVGRVVDLSRLPDALRLERRGVCVGSRRDPNANRVRWGQCRILRVISRRKRAPFQGVPCPRCLRRLKEGLRQSFIKARQGLWLP